MAKKSPNAIDVYVGSRIHTRRKMLRMSQEKLGNRLGLTFQQVQKYEKGANRVGASRLQALSIILEVPIGYFFEGAPQVRPSIRTKVSEGVSTDLVADFIADPDGHALIKAFLRVKAPSVRRSVVQMVKSISDSRVS